MAEIDHEFADEVVCPYCGYQFRDSWEFAEYEDDIPCYECEKHFSIESHISRSFSTRKLCTENQAQHVWKDSRTRPGEYRHCGVCGKCEAVTSEK